MEIKFKNVEDIKKYFNIEISETEELQNELKKKLAENHPDKTGGTYENDEQKNLFFACKEALDFLEHVNLDRKTLVPVETIRDLILSFQNENKRANINYPELIKSKSELEIKEMRKKFLFPNISVSTVTGITSFIWLFPQTISEHPILGSLIATDSNFFTIFWLALLFLCGYLWFFSKFFENKKQKTMEYISSEYYQEEVLKEFFYYKKDWSYMEDNLNKQLIFSKNEVKDFLYHHVNDKRINFSSFSPAFVDTIVDSLVSIAEDRKIIQKTDSIGFSPTYVVTIDI